MELGLRNIKGRRIHYLKTRQGKKWFWAKSTSCLNPQNYTVRYLFLKINNQNLTNIQKFWHQMNEFEEKRTKSPRLRKMVEKWVKTTKEKQWHNFATLRGKILVKRGRRWSGSCLVIYLNHCDGSSKRTVITCGRPILTTIKNRRTNGKKKTKQNKTQWDNGSLATAVPI